MFRRLCYILLLLLLVPWADGCAAPKGVYHTVQPGQTLYRIGRVYQVDVNQIARINRLSDRSQLQVGQRLFIPGASRIKYVPATVAAIPKPPSRPAPRSSKAKSAPVATTSAAKRPTEVPPAANPARRPIAGSPATARKGSFVWPVKGAVLKKFGDNGGQASKGIEIAAGYGSAVLAAAAGKVTYSGDGIKGFGNLLILKHDDSYFTVYGFNETNLVKTGSFVSQGQKIARAGRPPGGGQSRLHFEIRRGKEAVNPLSLLP